MRRRQGGVSLGFRDPGGNKVCRDWFGVGKLSRVSRLGFWGGGNLVGEISGGACLETEPTAGEPAPRGSTGACAAAQRKLLTMRGLGFSVDGTRQLRVERRKLREPSW